MTTATYSVDIGILEEFNTVCKALHINKSKLIENFMEEFILKQKVLKATGGK